jgi:hypothetical protein
MGLDPNTVAMYLDNTLSSDRVPDFEKVCLESDVHLAEVAACHQVLALVLGEPAEVDSNLRQRLYQIGEGGADGEAEKHKPPPLPAVIPSAGRRDRPRVPDYLREDRRSRWWAVAATLLLALLLGAAVVRALGPYDRTNPALAWLPVWGEQDAAVAKSGAQPDKEAPPADSQDAASDNRVTDDGSAPGANDNGAVGNAPLNGGAGAGTKEPRADEAPPANVNIAAPPSTRDAAVAGPAATKAGSATLTNPVEQNGKAVPLDGPRGAVDAGPDAPVPPLPTGVREIGPTNTAATPALDFGPDAATDAARNTVPPTGDAAAPAGNDTRPAARDSAARDSAARDSAARSGPEPLGRFLTDRNVLLRMNRAGEWERVPQGATLNAGERLLVLPTYRPSISLSAGLTMQLLGETLVEFLGADSGGIPRIRIPYGRAVLMTAGRPDVSINLVFGGQEGTATFLGAESTLAVEVRRFLPAGADPEKEQAYVAIDLYAAGGDVEWKLSQNPMSTRITAPGRLGLGTEYPFETGGEEGEPKVLPEWITAEKTTGVHQIASEDLNMELAKESGKTVALVLREFAEHRKWERKHLGARSLALTGEFDPFVAAFNDYDQRSVWGQQIDSLKAALARGPETAAKVRQAFQQQRGKEDGWKLYRMLGGYSKEDVQNGAAEELVGNLNHPSWDFRVLAVHALWSIPGVPPRFGDLPSDDPSKRRTQLQRWRQFIKSENSPLSAEGALDRRGPKPKQPWRMPANLGTGDESAAIPQSVPVLR